MLPHYADSLGRALPADWKPSVKVTLCRVEQPADWSAEIASWAIEHIQLANGWLRKARVRGWWWSVGKFKIHKQVLRLLWLGNCWVIGRTWLGLVWSRLNSDNFCWIAIVNSSFSILSGKALILSAIILPNEASSSSSIFRLQQWGCLIHTCMETVWTNLLQRIT